MGILEALFGGSTPERDLLDREVSAHFEKWFGAHDEQTDRESFIEIRSIPPNDKFPFRVIHTVGMASKAMKTKKGQEPLAEFMMVLPTEWSYGEDPEWPIHAMRRFGHMFHDMSACVTEFITVPHATPLAPIPGTPFCGLMAVRPMFVPPAAHRVELSSGQTVQVYALMPMLMVEMKFVATQTDPEALWCIGRSQKRDPLELLVVDLRRPPVV